MTQMKEPSALNGEHAMLCSIGFNASRAAGRTFGRSYEREGGAREEGEPRGAEKPGAAGRGAPYCHARSGPARTMQPGGIEFSEHLLRLRLISDVLPRNMSP
jgi:hypothetical protein